ncbi:hypothetical protein Tco_0721514 [Tanacetum coccineum]
METKDTISSCSETKDVHAIKYKMSKAKERCMAYLCSFHSHLQVLSKEYLKGTRIKHGFKRAFMSSLVKIMRLSQYDRRVNKRQTQTHESKVDTRKALDADLVVTESNGTESEVQDESSMSGNDTDTDDADIRPIYDEEPMDEEQITAKKLLDSCTSKVDSELPNGSNVDISKIHECKQTLDFSAGKYQSVVAEKADISKTSVTSWKVYSVLCSTNISMEKIKLFQSLRCTTADASDKRQQQPDLTSSTSTLATTVTADGNFDFKQVRLAGDLGSTNDALIPLVEMDDANLTMEEYIKLEAEKYLRRGQMFNWETAAYEKARISFDESDDEDYTFIYDKTSVSCKLIPVNYLKTDSENDNIKVNVSWRDIFIEQ